MSREHIEVTIAMHHSNVVANRDCSDQTVVHRTRRLAGSSTASIAARCRLGVVAGLLFHELAPVPVRRTNSIHAEVSINGTTRPRAGNRGGHPRGPVRPPIRCIPTRAPRPRTGVRDPSDASPKISPCTAPTASAYAASVRYMRVRTTCAADAPNSPSAARMISRQRRACAAGSGSTSPDGHTGAVPETSTRSPTRTARLNPMLASNGEPDDALSIRPGARRGTPRPRRCRSGPASSSPAPAP